MGCRSSNLAVVTNPQNGAGAAAAVAAAQFIMVNPGDLEKDLSFLKTNGYQKTTTNNANSTNGNNTSMDHHSEPNGENNNGEVMPTKSPSPPPPPAALLRVKNGVVSSAYAQYRKPIPNVSIWKFLQGYIEKIVEKHGQDYEWLMEVGNRKTVRYSEVDEHTKRIGSAFTKLGIQPHDVVIIFTTNTMNVFLVVLAMWRLNVTVKVTNPEDNQLDVVLGRITESNAKCIVCDRNTGKVCQDAEKKLSSLLVVSMESIGLSETGNVQDMMNDDGSAFPGDLQDFNLDVNNDIIYIAYTAGATGTSKAVMHTHKTIVASLMQGSFFRPSQSRHIMMPMRVFHLSGMIWPLAILLKGKTCLLIDAISSQGIYEAIQEQGAETLCGFPSFLVTLAIKLGDLGLTCPCLTSIVTSGETINKSGVDTIKKAFPSLVHVDVSFLMAEILSVTSTIPYHDFEKSSEIIGWNQPGQRDNKIGFLCCYSSAKVMNPDTGANLDTNQSGELCFRAHSIMKGYVGQESAQKTLDGGWVHTGDCGYYDQTGMFYVTGRLSEVFKCFGEYVSPIQLEALLLDHPDVNSCTVVGVPDDEAGTVACAVVSRRYGATTSTNEIKTFIDAQVEEHEQLKGGVIFIDTELPKTKTGQVSRVDVLRMVLNLNKMKQLKK